MTLGLQPEDDMEVMGHSTKDLGRWGSALSPADSRVPAGKLTRAGMRERAEIPNNPVAIPSQDPIEGGKPTVSDQLKRLADSQEKGVAGLSPQPSP